MRRKMDFYFYSLVSIIVVLLGGSFGVAQDYSSNLLDSLENNTKVISPEELLTDFREGKERTSVIVIVSSLEVTARQNATTGEKADTDRAPSSAVSGISANLDTEAGKQMVRTSVSALINGVADQLDTAEITVTRRFTYLSGFTALVTPEGLEQLVNLPDVVSVEKNRILHAHLGQGIPLMNATSVRSSYGGSGISIAICDTGIDTSHPRLGNGGSPYFNAKVVGGYDTGDVDDDPRPDLTSGRAHGTACAGIAAGDTGTVGDYIGGVAPDAKLYAIKISTGNTGDATEAAMIAGWEWAISHQNDDPGNPILIISTSFGGDRFYSACDSASPGMTTAAANAVAAGITIFASSGNDGYCDSMGWPACISHVNSVGAVYDADFGPHYPCVDAASCAPKTATVGCSTGWYATDATLPDMVTSYSNSASFLDIFAPSNQAYTADITGVGGYDPGDYATGFGGTSAACPYTAGAAAVLQHAAKSETGNYLTPAQVKQYLVGNGDSITDGKVSVTKPRVNLGEAVAAVTGIMADEYLLIERFDDIATLPGDGWVQINHSEPLGSTNWFQGNSNVFPSQEGAPNSYIGANFNNTSGGASGGEGTISNWLITPVLNLSRIGDISFWSRAGTQTWPDRLEVRVSNAGDSTDVGTSATDVGNFTTVLLTINPNLLTSNYPEVWTKYVIDNLAVRGSGRIAFRYFVANAAGPVGSLSNYIGIDSVGVSETLFPWPMFLPAITGSEAAPPAPPQWGAHSIACCGTSPTTFTLTSSSVTKKSYVANCSATPTWEGWVASSAGTHSFAWTLTSTGCGSYNGNFNWTMDAGKEYVYQMEPDGSGGIVIKVYFQDISTSSQKETINSSSISGEELKASMQFEGMIPLDIPKGAFTRSSCKLAE